MIEEIKKDKCKECPCIDKCGIAVDPNSIMCTMYRIQSNKTKKEVYSNEPDYKDMWEKIKQKVTDRSQKGFNTREETAIWWTVVDFITIVEHNHGIKEDIND